MVVKIPTSPRIIALGGPKYSGKDTLAKALFQQTLITELSPAFVKTPMAAAVKQICHQVFGWRLDLMEDPIGKELETTGWPFIAPREGMMDVANWFRDRFGGNIWVEVNKRLIYTLHRTQPSWAYTITDWRFPEETEWLEEEKALRIYVSRTAAEESLATKQAEGDLFANNPSESHYAHIRESADYIIENNGTIEDAQNQLLHIVREHYGPWFESEPAYVPQKFALANITSVDFSAQSLNMCVGDNVITFGPDGKITYKGYADEAIKPLVEAWQRAMAKMKDN